MHAGNIYTCQTRLFDVSQRCTKKHREKHSSHAWPVSHSKERQFSTTPVWLEFNPLYIQRMDLISRWRGERKRRNEGNMDDIYRRATRIYAIRTDGTQEWHVCNYCVATRSPSSPFLRHLFNCHCAPGMAIVELKRRKCNEYIYGDACFAYTSLLARIPSVFSPYRASWRLLRNFSSKIN